MRARYADNAAHVRRQQRVRHLRHKYGLTPDAYDELHQAQGGRCAVCGREESTRHPGTGETFSLAVDHDHRTGRLRGLLCRHCNLALGYVGDSVETLEALVRYLKEHH
jgi:hypothetical protein